MLVYYMWFFALALWSSVCYYSTTNKELRRWAAITYLTSPAWPIMFPIFTYKYFNIVAAEQKQAAKNLAEEE